jgi:predicted DNA-binding protein
VNVNLSDAEYRKLEAIANETGMNKSQVIREFINRGKVEVRNDAHDVIMEHMRVQNNINSMGHKVLDKYDETNKRIDTLEARIEQAGNMPGFRIVLAKIREDTEQIKNEFFQVKNDGEKEMLDYVCI